MCALNAFQKYAMSASHKRKQLTLSDKVELLNKVEAGNKKATICKQYNLPPSTLSTLIKNKEKIRVAFEENSKRKRLRTTKKLDLDTALLNWFKIQRNANIPISGPILQERATQFGVSLGYGSDFQCSISWISRFKDRHNINCGKVSGEARSVDESVTQDWLKNSWPIIKQGYSASDIFNADETGLFYKLTPDKTLRFKHEKCVGGKLSKERLSVLVCANADGSEKRRLLIIGKATKPRCFKNIKKLPVEYTANKRAWMTADIFMQEIRKWDEELRAQNRKILLLVDNCTAHPKIPNLHNIKLVHLPPNTTAVLQPMDQGIINSLKVYFRKALVIRLIEELDTNVKKKINVLDAIHFIDRAWKCGVTQECIRNCFKHAGFTEATENTDSSVLENHHFDLEDEIPLSLLFGTAMGNLNFTDYAEVDSMLVTSGDPTEDEIVDQAYKLHNPDSASTSQPYSESSDDEEETPEITSKEARASIQNLRLFFQSRNEHADNPFLLLARLENELDSTVKKNLQQKKITDYIFQ